ncbi:MAG: hypothetical protein JWM88_1405 [Verrucomicrobia bacterium]|nr:hypothetical protein [Verrucomicrobiota bacterium]
MKRFVAIVLTLLCAAFGQLPAVATLAPDFAKCPCCEKSGACGQSDCALPPAPAVTATAAESSTSVTAPVVREACRVERQAGKKFYAAFVATGLDRVAGARPVRAAPPASEPLFRTHCSLLI